MELKAPGLKSRPRGDGSTAYYWVASAVARDTAGYSQKTVRLHGDEDEVANRCRILTAELKEWLGRKGIGNKVQYDGTLRSVINLYRQTKESPYHAVKSNTRAMYDESLDLLECSVGGRRLEKLNGLDFKRWHANLAEPAEDTEKQAKARAAARTAGECLPPNPPRLRRAYKAMQLLRIVIKFGVVLDLKECVRLAIILENMEFSAPKARKERITFEQTQAICEKAMAKGWISIALAQALEFELTLRQIDVIGRWEKVDGESFGGIVDRGRRWLDGLIWADIDANGILYKETSKTGQAAEHDTMAYPFLRSIIDMIPPSQRIGPMIKCESTGLPYRYRHFAERWREVAKEAGVPSNVWNRDSRAGGVTEGSDAGADIEHLRHHANHKNAATTQRYNRPTLGKTRTVANLRIAKRNAGNGSDTGL